MFATNWKVVLATIGVIGFELSAATGGARAAAESELPKAAVKVEPAKRASELPAASGGSKVAGEPVSTEQFRQVVQFASLALERKAPALALFCFDLMVIDGVRVMALPLMQRRKKLEGLIEATASPNLLFSGSFDNPIELLTACERMDLEGIPVSEGAIPPDSLLVDDDPVHLELLAVPFETTPPVATRVRTVGSGSSMKLPPYLTTKIEPLKSWM